MDISELRVIYSLHYEGTNNLIKRWFKLRPSQAIFLFLVPSHINFWLYTILAIIGIAHVLFYLMLIPKLVKCFYTVW